MQEVRWAIPAEVDPAQYDETRILRANTEEGVYVPIKSVKSVDGEGLPVTRFVDSTGTRGDFYVVRFFSTADKKEYIDFELGWAPVTPREKRLIKVVQEWVPDVITPDLSEWTLTTMLHLSLNAFNVQSPETNFRIDGFPSNYEHFLIYGTEINILLLKQIRLGIRDFGYSDMGFQLTIDRDAKLKSAIDQLKDMYWSHMALGKLNFASMGLGLGTVPLPISFGGQMSRSLLNALDIFTAMGR